MSYFNYVFVYGFRQVLIRSAERLYFVTTCRPIWGRLYLDTSNRDLMVCKFVWTRSIRSKLDELTLV